MMQDYGGIILMISTLVSQLGLASFNTLMHTYRFSFAQRITMSDSCLKQCLRWLYYAVWPISVMFSV